jgi:hypothetical protein
MSLLQRRQLLVNFAIGSLSACLPVYSNAFTPNPIGGFQHFDNRSIDGLVLAWEALECLNPVADLWTGRVSDIDTLALPLGFRRIIMWDDLFSCKALQGAVALILDSMPIFYGFDCRAEPNGMSFHLVGINTLEETIDAACLRMASTAVAVVDLDACGVTPIDWKHVLPELRRHYDVIVGLAHGIEESFDWLELVEADGAFFCPSSLSAMKQCDFGVYASSDYPGGHWEMQVKSRVSGMPSDAQWLIGAIEKLETANFTY